MAKGIYINPNTYKKLDDLKLGKEIATRSIVNGNFASFFNILPDPDPILRKLGVDVKVYNDLLADGHVNSVVQRRKMGVKSLDWNIIPDEASDTEVELCKTALKNLRKNDGKRKNRVKDIISQSLNTPLYGMTVFEVTWEKVGKYFLPRLVEEKPLEWFRFDNENRLLLITADSNDGIPVDSYKYKFITLQNEPTYSNPYGDKALSRCFWPVTFKRGGMKFWATFVEKYGMPFLFGKLPRSAGQEEHAELLDKLDNMVRDAVATIPDDGSIDAIDAKGSSNGDIYEKFINVNNNEISKAILTNTLSTEVQNKGSYAASKTHRETEYVLAQEDAEYPEELFNTLFEYIVDINIGSGKYPKYSYYKEDEVNKEVAERDEILTKQGVKFNKKYYISKFNLKDDEFELTGTTENEFSEPAKSKDILDEIDFNAQSEKLLKKVITDLNKKKSYDEILENLATLYPLLDSGELEEVLNKAIFIKELEGRNA